MPMTKSRRPLFRAEPIGPCAILMWEEQWYASAQRFEVYAEEEIGPNPQDNLWKPPLVAADIGQR
jgi:hypothetical protein